MTPDDERELAAAIEATLAELRDDGASDADLAEFAAHVAAGFDALGAEFAPDDAAIFRVGDEVPDQLRRVFVGAAFAEDDPRLMVERYLVGDRLAVRRWRIGEMRRRVLRFAD